MTSHRSGQPAQPNTITSVQDWDDFIGERADAEVLRNLRAYPESIDAPDSLALFLLLGAAGEGFAFLGFIFELMAWNKTFESRKGRKE